MPSHPATPSGQPAALGCLVASTRKPPLVAICQLIPQLLGVNPWNPFTGAAAAICEADRDRYACSLPVCHDLAAQPHFLGPKMSDACVTASSEDHRQRDKETTRGTALRRFLPGRQRSVREPQRWRVRRWMLLWRRWWKQSGRSSAYCCHRCCHCIPLHRHHHGREEEEEKEKERGGSRGGGRGGGGGGG